MKIHQHMLFITLLLSQIQCGENTMNVSTTKLHLSMNENAEFNPNANHGKIEKFKLHVTGSNLPGQIEKIYPYGTESATIEGLPADSDVIITLEAINVNDIPVRRGESTSVKIESGKNTTADLKINNIPIFANVRNGAIVYNNRFSPKIFAPGEINFQIIQQIGLETGLMEDVMTDSSSFSISSDIATSVMTIHTTELDLGSHQLTVRDPDTKEASSIEITVLDGKTKKGLATTAGAYLGSPIGQQSSMIHQQQLMSHME